MELCIPPYSVRCGKNTFHVDRASKLQLSIGTLDQEAILVVVWVRASMSFLLEQTSTVVNPSSPTLYQATKRLCYPHHDIPEIDPFVFRAPRLFGDVDRC